MVFVKHYVEFNIFTTVFATKVPLNPTKFENILHIRVENLKLITTITTGNGIPRLKMRNFLEYFLSKNPNVINGKSLKIDVL